MATVIVTLLFSLAQAGWANIILCPATDHICLGTPGDDIILTNPTLDYNVVYALGGNDFIIGRSGLNYLYGYDGDDILIGGMSSDFLSGGKGNDKYDGSFGDDTIKEDITATGIVGTLINNNDIISGGEGDDWIQSGEGYDKIDGGPGSDSIYPNGYSRDFSFDVVNCGSGSGDKVYNFHSGDGETTANCETVADYDR